MAMNAITCPTCGVEEVFRGAGNESPPPMHEVGKFKCDGCGTRYVYGKRVPRVVVEPNLDHKGLRWTRIRIQHPITKEDEQVFEVDPETALALAKNILSLV